VHELIRLLHCRLRYYENAQIEKEREDVEMKWLLFCFVCYVLPGCIDFYKKHTSRMLFNCKTIWAIKIKGCNYN